MSTGDSMAMEIKLSLLLLALLLISGAALSAGRPKAVGNAREHDLRALAELEDAAALARNDLEVTRRLATSYLHLGQPGLAIAAVRSAPAELARDAVLTHRLSQAYEASGRVDDALNTAQLALARCTPRSGCPLGTAAGLETHVEALTMLQRWGVQEPRRDTRTALAYRLAQRTARIASLALPAVGE
jgi:tetratricopeptide (TPR) repeat protein